MYVKIDQERCGTAARDVYMSKTPKRVIYVYRRFRISLKNRALRYTLFV